MNTFDDVAAWLRSRPGKARIVGGGSKAATLADPGGANELSMAAFAGIERLDPGDQTCTVESGVPRHVLDEALHEHGLELPCLGDGTIGGLFAADLLGPAAAGSPGPRNLLLGMDALLADGTAFKTGARVVKSVAGFDVHKLFVGSNGRLFVAKRLHLRLKPRPRSEQWFANRKLERERALALVHALRHEEQPPTVLQLRRDDEGYTVLGRATGRAVHVTALCKRHGLEACEPQTTFGLEANGTDGEVLTGNANPGSLPALLQLLPDDAPFQWLGGGRFEVWSKDHATTDDCLAALPGVHATAKILTGSATRRGQGTLIDPGEQRLADGLKHTLDPDGILV